MRFSARSTDRGRRAGFTLLEVIIAVTIFSVVLIVALSQMNESGDAVRLATLQADLRKSGERVLAQIVKDIRSTQVVYSGANANAIEMAKVSGFDTTNKLNVLEGNTNPSSSANVVGNSTIIYKYYEPSTDNSTFGGDKNLGCLIFEKSTKATILTTPTLTTRLCQELAKQNDTDWPYAGSVSGFTIERIDGAALPGLLTANTAFATYNTGASPVTLRIKLVLKRAAGFSQNTPTNVKRQFVWTTLDTQVQLRTDESY